MIRDDTLATMARDLGTVPGIEAVVFGGSRARGTHHDGSDVDLGLYYDRNRLDPDGLHAVARRHTGTDVEIAGPGQWGPWVDGGCWLRVEDTPVDWILRDIDRVRAQRDRAIRGEFAFHAQPGHPLGFLDVAYAGEVVLARPLDDPDGVIEELRVGLVPYPQALRTALVRNVWQAGFLLDGAVKGASRADVAYVALCCSSAALICAHGWHAAAGQWVLNEKDLVPGVGRLGAEATSFPAEVAATLATIGADEMALLDSIDRMRRIVDATSSLLAQRS